MFALGCGGEIPQSDALAYYFALNEEPEKLFSE